MSNGFKCLACYDRGYWFDEDCYVTCGCAIGRSLKEKHYKDFEDFAVIKKALSLPSNCKNEGDPFTSN
jgi:hypothetical protein